jgi:hypothetical protein
MASTWGARRGEPAFDRFRTNLTFAQVQAMSRGPRDDPDPKKRHSRYRRRGVLGAWHEIKLLLYRAANPGTLL